MAYVKFLSDTNWRPMTIFNAIPKDPCTCNERVDKGIIRCLLEYFPDAISLKLQTFDGKSLLHFACLKPSLEPPEEHYEYYESNIDAVLESIKVIYDAHPEAIDNTFVQDIQRWHPQVQLLVIIELVYACQAKDHRLMMAPDENGYLPLHTALQNNVRLGSIKLLVKGNPFAIRTLENNAALPLHIACEHHDSLSVVEYLIGLDKSTLDVVDNAGNTALHYACRGAKYETIAFLLEKYDAVTVSKRNSHKKLPIDLLLESNAVGDRESIKYTESVFRLLREYPEMIMTSNVDILTG